MNCQLHTLFCQIKWLTLQFLSHCPPDIPQWLWHEPPYCGKLHWWTSLPPFSDFSSYIYKTISATEWEMKNEKWDLHSLLLFNGPVRVPFLGGSLSFGHSLLWEGIPPFPDCPSTCIEVFLVCFVPGLVIQVVHHLLEEPLSCMVDIPALVVIPSISGPCSNFTVLCCQDLPFAVSSVVKYLLLLSLIILIQMMEKLPLNWLQKIHGETVWRPASTYQVKLVWQLYIMYIIEEGLDDCVLIQLQNCPVQFKITTGIDVVRKVVSKDVYENDRPVRYSRLNE